MKRRRPARLGQLPSADAAEPVAKQAELSPTADAAPSAAAGPVALASGSLGSSRALRSFVVEVSAGRRAGAAEVVPEEDQAAATATSPDAVSDPPGQCASSEPSPLTDQDAAAKALLASDEPAVGAAAAHAEAVGGAPRAASSGASRPASAPSEAHATTTASPQRRLDKTHQGTVRENEAQPPVESRGPAQWRGPVESRGSDRHALRTVGAPAQQPAAADSAAAAAPLERQDTIRAQLAEDRPTPPLRRRLPSWALSLLAHVGLLAALSLTTLASLAPEPDFTLLASSGPSEIVEEFADFELTEESLLEELPDAAAPQAIDPGAESAAALGAVTPLGGPGLDALGSVGAGPFGSPLGGPGDALTPFGSGLGEAAVASFFGMRIEGRRICFVLDNSGSMQGGRLETVIAELNRSLAALRPDQSFYVLFYSDDVYPLFFPEAADGFAAASPAACEAVRAWLETVELCYGDVVDEAIAAAWSLEPDVVYLLSDGKIQSERDLALLLGPGKPFAIHTVGVGLGAGPTMRERLQNIAAANGGEFREAEVAEEQRQLALERPRRYHRTEPGTTWGRRVRPPR